MKCTKGRRNCFDQQRNMAPQVFFLRYQIQQSTICPTEGRNEETYRKPQAPVEEDRCVNGCKVDIISASIFICLIDF